MKTEETAMQKELVLEVEEVTDLEELNLVYAMCGLIGCGGQITH